jgi:hypothetical protein
LRIHRYLWMVCFFAMSMMLTQCRPQIYRTFWLSVIPKVFPAYSARGYLYFRSVMELQQPAHHWQQLPARLGGQHAQGLLTQTDGQGPNLLGLSLLGNTAVQSRRRSREAYYKGKAQYSWPPCTYWFRSAPFYIENIIYLSYKTTCLNVVVNCIEPSRSVSIPRKKWLTSLVFFHENYWKDLWKIPWLILGVTFRWRMNTFSPSVKDPVQMS